MGPGRVLGLGGACIAALVLAACEQIMPVGTERPETALEFPLPDRPVVEVVSNQFSNEDARDERNEAQVVMDLADIRAGMTVADIGAGEGYYTVRLAERVGEDGRVLAQDIDPEALDRLGRRIERERLENISIKAGNADNPQLPPDSFDRIFMVHMYHEVTEPYAFLWHMWPALSAGGQIPDLHPPGRQHLAHRRGPGRGCRPTPASRDDERDRGQQGDQFPDHAGRTHALQRTAGHAPHATGYSLRASR